MTSAAAHITATSHRGNIIRATLDEPDQLKRCARNPQRAQRWRLWPSQHCTCASSTAWPGMSCSMLGSPAHVGIERGPSPCHATNADVTGTLSQQTGNVYKVEALKRAEDMSPASSITRRSSSIYTFKEENTSDIPHTSRRFCRYPFKFQPAAPRSGHPHF